MNLTVLGAGAWGTALARHLHHTGHPITLWAHDPARLDAIRATWRNERHLPGVELPRDWHLEADLPSAIRTAQVILIAVPSQALREVATSLGDFNGTLITVTKGIEHDTGMTMGAVLGHLAPQAHITALSGPTLAAEVARGVPSAIVAASHDPETALLVQNLIHTPSLRVYTSTDPVGVELGGALKNVMAIAAGVCDGLGYGDNSKAALLTRALSEMRRLGHACGARPETFSGLSGLGDLSVTFFSRLSRNRTLGERLGRGENLSTILASTASIAEGHPTARSAHRLARQHGLTTPIIDAVHAVLYLGTPPAAAVRDLLHRDSRAED